MNENDCALGEALDLIESNLENVSTDTLVGLIENAVDELQYRADKRTKKEIE